MCTLCFDYPLPNIYTVLQSEVEDLRVCLKSADRELKEVKEEKSEEKRKHETKTMGYHQKVRERCPAELTQNDLKN